MYLLVVVALFIAILGTYSQLFSLQAGRIAANQTGMAQDMLAWHAAAVSMAESVLDTQTNGMYTTVVQSTGCSLSNDIIPGVAWNFTWCPPPVNPAQSMALQPTGTLTGALSGPPPYTINRIYNARASKQTECVHLPNATCTGIDPFGCAACTSTFDAKDYEFYSILYRSNGSDVVLTYASPGASSKYLTLASGKQLSLTQSDLIVQLRKTGIPLTSFGTVENSMVTAGGLQMSIPATANVPSGSIALIGFPSGR
jgi:hypothetical protein